MISVISMNRNVHNLYVVSFAFPIVNKNISYNFFSVKQSVINCSWICQKFFPVFFFPKISRKTSFIKQHNLTHMFYIQSLYLNHCFLHKIKFS